MRNFNKFITLLITALILMGCQTISDGLSMKKKSGADQFLIEKKNPLVLPPDFEKLPEPTSLETSNNNEEEDQDIKSILGQKPTKEKNSNKTESSALKDSIMKKIKKN